MDELLSIISDSDYISMPELTYRLHMSEAIINARLERYEQLGFVKRMVDNSEGGCHGSCGNCKGCGTHKPHMKPSVYWVRGEKLK